MLPHDKVLLLGNWLFTALLTGVIWFVQVVHYPLFQRVTAGFAAFHQAHTTRTGYVVMAPMLAELFVAGWLVLRPPAQVPAAQAWAALALVAVVWAVTFFVSVPLHQQLSQQYTAAAARRLVATNWVRTVAWTARLLLVTSWVARQW